MKDGIERYIQSVGVVKGRSMTTATMATVTRFRQRYDAGEVPARVAHGGGANVIAWRVDPRRWTRACTYRYSSTVCERRRIRIACWR